MNNCIGQYNRAHFVRFISSVSFGAIYSLLLLCLRLYTLILNQEYRFKYDRTTIPTFLGFNYSVVYPYSTTELVLFCIVAIVLLLLLISVGILTCYQLYYISQGQTTIENFELDKLADLVHKDYITPEKAIFPFNNGVYANFKEMFGDNPLFWMIPKRATGNGIHFQINKHYELKPVVVWPPMEYYRY